MIDLHLHLLPGIDDGAESSAVSLAMIERAASLRFSTLVATPHLTGALSLDYRERALTALESLRPAAAEAGVTISLGFEIMLSPDLPSRLERGEPSTLGGGRTVLVELPFGGWPAHAEQSLFALQAAGFRPLLAHPERYAVVHGDPERALALAERGVLLQVTFGSLVGVFGKAAQQSAERLLRANAATVLASDAHSAGRRFAAIEAGLHRAESLVGPARLEQLVLDAPKAILADRAVPAPLAVQSGFRSPTWMRSIRRAATRRQG